MKTPFTRRKFLKTSAFGIAAGMGAPLWQSHARAAVSLPAASPAPVRSRLARSSRPGIAPAVPVSGVVSRREVRDLGALGAAVGSRDRDWYARNMYLQGTGSTTTTSKPTATRPSSATRRDPDLEGREFRPGLFAGIIPEGRGEVLRQHGGASR